MEIKNKVARNTVIILDKKSAQPKGAQKYYFGAGWDPVGQTTDLDLSVIQIGDNGKAIPNGLIYYDNQKGPGIQLSEDNRTGEGEGDDEFVNIDTAKLSPNVKGLIIAIVAYSGDNFAKVANPHINGRDGDNAKAEEIFTFPIQDGVASDSTVLIACELTKEGDEWSLKTVGEFRSYGQGGQAFTKLLNSYA